MGVCAALILVDQLTKYFNAKDAWEFTVIKNFIWVVPVQYNDGAAFSLFGDKAWGMAFLIAVTIIALILMICFFLFVPNKFTVLKVALVMIIAGAIGNLIDRCAFYGKGVRDFVWIKMFGVQSCCNFADFWIVIGAVVAVIDFMFLNELAVFPLTKKARAAQAAKKEDTPAKISEEQQGLPVSTEEQTNDKNAENYENAESGGGDGLNGDKGENE